MTASAAVPGESGEPYPAIDGSAARLRTFLHGLPPVDPVGLVRRAGRFARRGIAGEDRCRAIDLAISMVDLTTLEGTDTESAVAELCERGLAPDPGDPGCPQVAAICVYPSMVATASRLLTGSGIAVASVATAFPSGQSPLSVRLAETEAAVAAGATEIDMVISRGAFLSGRYQQVFDEIVAVKQACGTAHLKVILETGELGSYDAVCWASWLAMLAGADFIKTSTGKTSPAATVAVTVVMMEAASQYHAMTGRKVGIKAAGGIRTADQAMGYLAALEQILGRQWCEPDLFRFGASSLLDDLLLARRKAAVSPSAGSVDPVAHLVEPADLDSAVAAARVGYRDGWGAMGAGQRARHLFEVAEALSANGQRLATIQARDGGTPLSTAVAETLPVLSRLTFSCAGVADKLRWVVPGCDRRAGSAPRAGGVVAVQPQPRPDLLAVAATTMRALACGNTVVLGVDGPSAALNLAFADVCRSAGLPEGALCLGVPNSSAAQTGPAESGAALLDHDGVDVLVTFGAPGRDLAGSTLPAPAWRLAGSGPTAESGAGHRPPRSIAVPDVTVAMIVFADAPLGEAVEGVVTDAFLGRGYLHGLGWLAGARLLVHEPIAKTFLAALDRRIGALRTGEPTDQHTDLPAWIDPVRRAVPGAADLGIPGAQDLGVAPNPTNRPGLQVTTFRTSGEAVAKAAKTRGPWCATVWTDKGSQGVGVATALPARQVWLNSATGSNPTCGPGLEAYLG